MPGFTSRDNVVEAYATGQTESYVFNKFVASSIWHGTPAWTALRTKTGVPALETVNPANATTTNYTGGNLNFPSRSATAGYRRSLLSFSAVAQTNSQGVLALYDRIQAVGANFAITTGRTPVTGVNVGRYGGASGSNSGANNELWIEQVTQSTAASTHQITYQDTSGTPRTGASFLVPLAVVRTGTMYRYPMLAASASHGVVQIVSAGGTNAAGGTGSYVIMKPIAFVSITAPNVTSEINFLDNVLTMPRIHDSANLQLMWLPTNTVSNAALAISGTITTVYN